MHEELAELTPLARLLFIGLWCMADVDGRMEDRPKRIKATVLPYDDADIDGLLNALGAHKQSFIRRYTVDGLALIEIPGFKTHQRITGKEAETKSKFPEYKQGNNRETTGKQPGNNQEKKQPGNNGETPGATEGRKEGREGKGIGKESATESPAYQSDANIPTEEEVMEIADVRMIPRESAKRFYDHHTGHNIWLNSLGHLINWQYKLKSWAERDRCYGLDLNSPTKSGDGFGPHQP
jgi:hypothetical protein